MWDGLRSKLGLSFGRRSKTRSSCTEMTETWAFVAADIALLAQPGPDSKGGWGSVLLIRRAKAPFAGMWALPGGKVNRGEGVEAAALRELGEETGLRLAVDDDATAPERYASLSAGDGKAYVLTPLRQVATFTRPGADPRGRVCSVLFSMVLDAPVQAKPASDASAAQWWPIDAVASGRIDLAFDHELEVIAAYGKERELLS